MFSRTTVTSTLAGIDCGGVCAADYLDNTPVTLTATADSDSTFAGWSGDCDGLGRVVMVADRSCTATFNLPDSDGDGVPDVSDLCPGFDDHLDGDPTPSPTVAITARPWPIPTSSMLRQHPGRCLRHPLRRRRVPPRDQSGQSRQ